MAGRFEPDVVGKAGKVILYAAATGIEACRFGLYYKWAFESLYKLLTQS